jgi:hypothetical protein
VAELYLIDANVMLQAANTYYSFQHVHGFWDWLSDRIEAGTIRTASLVADEIDFPQELVEWVEIQAAASFYVDISQGDIQIKFTEIATWIITQPYGPEHIAKFLNGADPWIIAAASVLGATVVTQEQAVPASSKKIKIPNVVPCVWRALHQHVRTARRARRQLLVRGRADVL